MGSPKNKWTRADKIALASVLVAVAAALGTFIGIEVAHRDANPPTTAANAGQSTYKVLKTDADGNPALVRFGSEDWQVLHVQNDRALVIAVNIVERRAYNDVYKDVTWETCTLREYLNGEYYNSFRPADRDRIIQVTNQNTDSGFSMDGEWQSVPGGGATKDYIFLLSVDDVEKYYPGLELNDSGWYYEADERLVATDKAGQTLDWWLRSPGNWSYGAASVGTGGYAELRGLDVYDGSVGVRPAMWISLESQ